jgi:hypothetical protein
MRQEKVQEVAVSNKPRYFKVAYKVVRNQMLILISCVFPLKTSAY